MLRVDPERHLRCVRGAREHVQHLADAACLRVGQVKALAVAVLRGAPGDERIDDEIDRNEVDVAAFDADQRHPARPGFTQLLQRLEEVVRSVDLVDDARLRVPDDRTRPVDPERRAAVRSHQRLGIVLRAVIRVIEILGLLEHVLRERAAVETRRRNRTHVVKARPPRSRARSRARARCRSILALRRLLGARLDVVNRAQVKQMPDLALELGRHRASRCRAAAGARSPLIATTRRAALGPQKSPSSSSLAVERGRTSTYTVALPRCSSVRTR